MNGWCERKVIPLHSKWQSSCSSICARHALRMYHSPFVRVPLTIRLLQSGQYHHLSVVLEVRLCLTAMYTGTGDSGSLRMHMRDP